MFWRNRSNFIRHIKNYKMKSITLNNNRMKTKVLFLLAFTSLMSWSALAQRGVRIGYIDKEYILQNVQKFRIYSQKMDHPLKELQMVPYLGE